MRILASLVLALLLALAPAWAQQALPEPAIAPPPAWVQLLQIGAPNPALIDRPVQALLSNSQSIYGENRVDHFVDMAFLIQNAQGLQAFGNIVIPWQAEHAHLIVHKVHIVRGVQTIDLLAGGNRFTVLRRENNLESAVLDGMLTAVMQAEGLAVGDVINVSWSIRRRPGTLPLRGENFFMLPHGQPMRRLNIRQIWPTALPIRWRGTNLFEQARTRETSLGTELILDLHDIEGPEAPTMAPSRFQIPALLELSQYRDWAEISTTLAPHYARARQLDPNSPLHQEVSRIAGLSQEPRIRAMAALRLVQDQVRYFALTIGDGNYLPPTAEQTWTRRYADCKGKTVLLLALLDALGIEAEAVLVNSAAGDMLRERLPMLFAFNHVVVRARIDGQSYWLDGTQSGDRDIAELASSTLGWGLPLRVSGATLEQILYRPPVLPLAETSIIYDGSSGLSGSIPTRSAVTYRGQFAAQMRAIVSQVGRDTFLRQMRATTDDMPARLGSISTVDFTDDPATGTFAIVFAGQANLTWDSVPAHPDRRRLRFDAVQFPWPSFERPQGSFRDAPFAMPVPLHFRTTQTIILPNGGRGFTVEGDSFDRVIAGTRVVRRIAIENGQATASGELRRLEPEVSAQIARASVAEFDAIADDKPYLVTSAALVRERR